MALDYLRRYAKLPDASSPLDAAGERPGLPAGLEALFDADSRPDGVTACFVAETSREGSDRHGLHAFNRLNNLSAERLALICRDPELSYLDLSGAVFLDTETTGLSLGAGTYVFLVGAGYVKSGAFHVRQFFLRSPNEEGEFLTALDAFLRGFSVLVTFNGKSFDWPLLENRFVGHRQFRRPPLVDPPHIDLLHPARRVWRRRLQSCALSSLETTILQVQRTEEDVPGWMIPSLYFAYLRSGDATALRRVFYHNLHDILSLAMLAVHLDHVLADPLAGAVQHASDFVCLARQYDLAGDPGRAIACLEAALLQSPSGDDRREALRRLAAIHKRERRWDAAVGLWDRLLEEGTEAALFALIERAKYYEHVERDYLEALDDVQRALQLAELAGAESQVDIRDLEHRRGRLLNRVYRERSWTRGR
jgi:uncharacterized protein YprB with RNaseH-like and TPR domain